MYVSHAVVYVCVFYFLSFPLSTLFSGVRLCKLTVPLGNLNWTQSDFSVSG
jgi:hypothetical protein